MTASELPEALRHRRQWVCWRYENREGKQTKVPVTPTGAPASSTDPTTWRDHNTVLMASDAFDGIGFVFTPETRTSE